MTRRAWGWVLAAATLALLDAVTTWQALGEGAYLRENNSTAAAVIGLVGLPTALLLRVVGSVVLYRVGAWVEDRAGRRAWMVTVVLGLGLVWWAVVDGQNVAWLGVWS